MKTKNFCGIFATVFAIATVITLTSCSQDDEYYYDSEMFTRSEEMMTRGGEQGGYTPTPTPVPSDTTYTSYLFKFEADDPTKKDSLPTFDVNINVKLYREDGNIAVKMITYNVPQNFSDPHSLKGSISMNVESFIAGGVYFEPNPVLPNRYKMCASGSMLDNFARVYNFKGVVENYVFF